SPADWSRLYAADQPGPGYFELFTGFANQTAIGPNRFAGLGPGINSAKSKFTTASRRASRGRSAANRPWPRSCLNPGLFELAGKRREIRFPRNDSAHTHLG